MVEQCRDPVSIAWTTVPVPYDERGRRGVRAAASCRLAGPTGREWAFAVELEGAVRRHRLAARRGPRPAPRSPTASHPDVRGTGAIERALRLLVDWGFAELGPGDDRVARLHRQLGQPASWPGGSGSRVEGTLRRYLPQRGDAARRLGRHAAEGRPARAALDLARRARAGRRRLPAAAGPRGRRPAHPRGHRGAGRPSAGWATSRRRTRSTTPGPTSSGAASSPRPAQCVTWAIADPDDDRILGTVLWFNWTPEVECEVGYWTHPDARGRGLATQGGPAGDRPRLRDARRQAGHRVRRGREHRLAPRGRGRRLPAVRRRAVRRAGPRRLGRHGALRRDGVGVGRPASGPARTPTASTANPASDSTAPITSGDR